MSIGISRRMWRHLSGYYHVRQSDLLYAIYVAEGGTPECLARLVEQIGSEGDMQRREFLLLQTMEVQP